MCSQVPITITYTKLSESGYYPYLMKVHFFIFLRYMTEFSKFTFPCVFAANTSCARFVRICICTAHVFILDIVGLMMFRDVYKL
jgi:hypothetical protein